MLYNLSQLDDYVDRGLLRRAEDEDLVQYNYSEKTNNQGLWDEITMFNRGNVYEKKTGKLIAKAMPKFMNLGQLSIEEQEKLVKQPKFTLTEKMDGCLGIIYKYKGKIRYNSRGGFNNHVTDKIKQLLPKYLMLNRLLEHNTLNVEVISPETKIICNYGNTEELYLITAFSNNNEEYNYKELTLLSQIMKMPIVKQYHMSWQSLLSWQSQATWEKEGFVVCFPNHTRVKIKSNDYLRIAKLRAGLTKHRVWKIWKTDLEQNTNLLEDYLNQVPDELQKTVDRYMSELHNSLEEQRQTVLDLAKNLINIQTKDLLKYFKDNPSMYQSCIFNLRSNKPIDKILIKFIEPETGFEDMQNVLYES